METWANRSAEESSGLAFLRDHQVQIYVAKSKTPMTTRSTSDFIYTPYTLCITEKMAQDTQPKVCLDVAVDHRIIRLFKPVPNGLTERSAHVSCIRARGLSLKRPPSEIAVTAQLAGPALKGGIAIALQQPRDNHPFEDGLDAVIEDCETLWALEDIFDVVSCGSLDIRTDIAVVDLLPYVSEDIENIDETTLKESFRASTQIICDKKPYVLLCAGRAWQLPKFDSRKGPAFLFESIGVGKKFGNTSSLPFEVEIYRGKRGSVGIRTVNGFHPSYTMNRHPHVSLLRQLQVLIGAETCGILREDWEEEEWMGELRRRCQDISRELSGKEKLVFRRVLYICRNSQTNFILNKGHRPNLLNHRAQAKAQAVATILSFCQTTKSSTLLHWMTYANVSTLSLRIQHWPRNHP